MADGEKISRVPAENQMNSTLVVVNLRLAKVLVNTTFDD